MWGSLDEDSPCRAILAQGCQLLQIAPQGGMSQGVVVWTGENTEEETSLLSVLAIVWAITFLVGSLCGVWFERSRSSKTPARSAAFASWERVTVRALRFLAKRRRVSEPQPEPQPTGSEPSAGQTAGQAQGGHTVTDPARGLRTAAPWTQRKPSCRR